MATTEPASKKQRQEDANNNNNNDNDEERMKELRQIFQTYQSWKDLPDDLKCRADVAYNALEKQWIQTIEQVPLQLQQDPKFRRDCIILGFRQRCDHADEITTFCDADYHELSEEWKNDPEVFLMALDYHRTTIRDIPEPCRSDRKFLQLAVRKWPRVFRDLPDELRNDIEFWLNDPNLTPGMLYAILRTHGTVLGPDRSFWVRLLNLESLKECHIDYMSLLGIFAPREFQLDQDLICAIVQKDAFHFLSLHYEADIWQNETFMRFFCETLETRHLNHIDKHLQLLHPHLIVEIVVPRVLNSTLPQVQKESLGWRLASAFWDDFHFIQTWFSHKGPFVNKIPKPWNLEPDQFLWIAEHCPGLVAKQCFSRAPEELLEDDLFLLDAMDFNPFLYCFATQDLQDDVEVRMMVCSRVGSYRELVDDCGMSAEHAKETREHVQARYDVYQNFRTFLGCMLHKTTAAPVTLLNQGPSTAMAYKSTVAKYLGIPRGDELQLVQKCVVNMENWDLV